LHFSLRLEGSKCCGIYVPARIKFCGIYVPARVLRFFGGTYSPRSLAHIRRKVKNPESLDFTGFLLIFFKKFAP
jgi:hypothetical protein